MFLFTKVLTIWQTTWNEDLKCAISRDCMVKAFVAALSCSKRNTICLNKADVRTKCNYIKTLKKESSKLTLQRVKEKTTELMTIWKNYKMEVFDNRYLMTTFCLVGASYYSVYQCSQSKQGKLQNSTLGNTMKTRQELSALPAPPLAITLPLPLNVWALSMILPPLAPPAWLVPSSPLQLITPVKTYIQIRFVEKHNLYLLLSKHTKHFLSIHNFWHWKLFTIISVQSLKGMVASIEIY